MDFDTSHLNTAPLASPVQSSQTTANDEGDYQFSLNEPFPGIFNDSEFNDNFDIYQSALSGLTESEETKKQRKDATPQNDAPNVTFPTYNPATLLNPKSAKRSAADSEAREDTPAQPINAAESSNGMSSMLERIHNVQQRHDQPVRKRRRVHPALADDADDPEEKVQEKSTNGFDGVSGGTVLGDYIKDKKAEGQKEAIANGNTVVDLTNDGDDDDLVITGQNKVRDREICLGRIDGAYINTYVVPSPNPNGWKGAANIFPAIKVKLQRTFGANNNIISAVDPAGKIFGKMDIKIAQVLTPLLHPKSAVKVRPVGRIEARKRRHAENPGQPTSLSIPLTLHFYALRSQAEQIGTYLSQRNTWLRQPKWLEKGVDVFNPHEPKNIVKPINGSGFGSGSGYVGVSPGYKTRTVEEARNEVIEMFDSLTKDENMPVRMQPETIKTPLLHHQQQALWFLWDREQQRSINEDDSDSVSLWRLHHRKNGVQLYYNVITGHEYSQEPDPPLGGILADVMGLGKTLSILSRVVDTIPQSKRFGGQAPPKDLKRNLKGTLLVCPMSTTANWEQQVQMHLEPKTLKILVYHSANRTKNIEDLAQFDLIITTYQTIAADFRRSEDSAKPLHEANWFRVVLDEAHQIRNATTGMALAACALSANRRWAVTGTPVQNRLEDLFALIKFLRLQPFDERQGFHQHIITPFKSADPEILPKVRLLVDSMTLRRLKDKIDLPKRHDNYAYLQFTDEERKLYKFFAEDSANRLRAATADGESKLKNRAYIHVLRAILRLRQICAHGSDLLSDEDIKMTEGISVDNAIELADDVAEDNNMKPVMTRYSAYDMLNLLRESDMAVCSKCQNAIDVNEVKPVSAEAPSAVQLEVSSDTEEDPENTLGFMTPCYQILCPGCIDDFRKEIDKRKDADNFVTCPLCETYIRAAFYELKRHELREEQEARRRLREDPKLARKLNRYSGPHTKTRALVDALKRDEAWSLENPDEAPIKSVVFSGWTSHLDLISLALTANGIQHTQLVGSMSRTQRSAALYSFAEDPAVTVILVSITAGGLGLNLTSANKVYVMEPQYNPAAEAQAVDRVHRLGQTREVFITRFIMDDSFELKMVELQNKKRRLAELTTGKGKLSRAEEMKKSLEDLKDLFRR